MSTPDTNSIGIKLQVAGENLNTWGDPNLNNDLIVLSNLASKFNALTVNTGGYTVPETNYSTTNDTEVALIKLNAGTIAAAFNFVIPGRAKCFVLWNNTGYTATCKLAATTGFALPTGRWTIVATDGTTDVYNMGSTSGGVASPLNSTDILNYGAIQTLIANAALPATAGTVRNSAADTTAGYLSQKITQQLSGLTTTQVSGLVSVVLATINPAGNEQLALQVGGGYVDGFLPGGTKAAQFTPVVGTDYLINCTSGGVTVGLSGMTTPQVDQAFKFMSYGASGVFLLGSVVVNGTAQTNLQLDPGANGLLRYTPVGWA